MAACSQPPATIENQPVSQKPAEFKVGPVTYAPTVVMVGDSVTLTTTVSNTGDMAGIYTAVLLVNGQESGRQDIPVSPENSQDFTFQLSETVAGNYSLSIGNSNTVLTVHNWVPYTIQYDNSNGAVAGGYVDGENGHLVQFSPPNKAFRVQKIMIVAATRIANTSELNNPVTFRIWDKDANNLLWSQDFAWSLFLNGDWQEIKVPDIRVNDDFRVEVVTHSYVPGYPIDFVSLVPIIPPPAFHGGGFFRITEPLIGYVQSAVLIGFDYPQSYINSPTNRPETRSGYSYMGKLIDPGQKRLEGINWLIRVDGEGAPGS
jgi:hypothetical protein